MCGDPVFRTQLASLTRADLFAIADLLNLEYADLADVFRLAAGCWLDEHPGDTAYLAHLAGISHAYTCAKEWEVEGDHVADADTPLRSRLGAGFGKAPS